MDDLDALLADLQLSTSKNIYENLNAPPNINSFANINLNDEPKVGKNSQINLSQRNENNNTPKRASSAALTYNLSELDVLLQDLSSAQFSAEIDRRSSGVSCLSVATHSNNSLSSDCNSPIKTNKQNSSNNELVDMMNSLDTKPKNNSLYSYPIKPNIPIDLISSNQSLNRSTNGSPASYRSNEYKSSHLVLENGSTLNEMLEDLNLNLKMQGVSTVPKGHCGACLKPIVGQVITAMSQLWHPEHFVCQHCRETIGTKTFFERDGLPYCERDFHLLFSPRCAACNGPILDKCVTAMDRTWHPEHFICSSCGHQLADEAFHEKDGYIYCSNDFFRNFAPKCGGCGQSIIDTFITALEKQWHHKCFACHECHVQFTMHSNFYEYEGFPFCELHYHAKRGSLCAACHQPVTGRCITAMYKKFHPEHFVCTFCQRQLNKGTFKEENDKPYCHPCYVKLFN